jgi:hypothetical protein
MSPLLASAPRTSDIKVASTQRRSLVLGIISLLLFLGLSKSSQVETPHIH